MIYLIGGAPRVGKSTIVREFDKSLKGQFVSTDELEDPNQNPSVIFYSDPKKNTLTPSKRIEFVKNEAKQIIPNIIDIIDEAITEHQDIAIEGVHLFPVHVDNFMKKFGKENVKAIFIGSTNTELILEGLVRNTSQNNWLKDFNREVLKQVAAFTKVFSDYLYSETKKYNLLYKERSNDFQKDMREVIKGFC